RTSISQRSDSPSRSTTSSASTYTPATSAANSTMVPMPPTTVSRAIEGPETCDQVADTTSSSSNASPNTVIGMPWGATSSSSGQSATGGPTIACTRTSQLAL